MLSFDQPMPSRCEFPSTLCRTDSTPISSPRSYGAGETVAVSVGGTTGGVIAVSAGAIVGTGVIAVVADGASVGVGVAATDGDSVREQLLKKMDTEPAINRQAKRRRGVVDMSDHRRATLRDRYSFVTNVSLLGEAVAGQPQSKRYRQRPPNQTQPPGRWCQRPSTHTAARLGRRTHRPGTQA